MTYEIEVVNKKIGSRERHITTIAGPQAAAILEIQDGHHVYSWRDKSVDRLSIIELWVNITHYEEEAGTYS